MNPFLSTVSCVLTAFLSSISSAQNIIDFHIEIDGVSRDGFLADANVSSQRHKIHFQIDTNAAPIFETSSLTRFGIEIVSWEFWDFHLNEQGFVNTIQTPFSTDGNLEPILSAQSLLESDLINPDATLKVQEPFWTLSAFGRLDGLNPGTNNDYVDFSFRVFSAFPEFALGIESLPDDPTLYSFNPLDASSRVEISTTIGEFDISTDWPIRPVSDSSVFAWSAVEYAEPEPECLADINNDGFIDFFDISAYLQLYSNGCP